MNVLHSRFLGYVLSGVLLCALSLQSLNAYVYNDPGCDLRLSFLAKDKEESFYGKNLSLLNNCNPADQIVFARHTLDLVIDAVYGRKKYDLAATEFKCTLRNKGVWGNQRSIASTTNSDIRSLDALIGTHSHSLPRHVLWIRELWLDFDIATALGLTINTQHRFMVGAFPFELGRGISLGVAYAIAGQEFLGLYTDSNVDQFAFGAKFYGDLLPDTLAYDWYAAILQNNSASLSDTTARIFGQQIGRLTQQERGFGHISFITAGRLNWILFENDDIGKLSLEPYALYNHDPEQRVEFIADASGQLGTFGLAGEYVGPVAQFGFDSAINVGHQTVRPWDRNQVVEQLRNGVATRVNSHVYVNVNPLATPQNINDQYLAPFAPNEVDPVTGAIVTCGKQVQNLINNAATDASESEAQNGQLIGSVPCFATVTPYVPAPVSPATVGNLYNAPNRFRNGFENKYAGWMFVADASCWVTKDILQLAATGGVASGGENPNIATHDERFDGFIGLQEIYVGKRVKSAFVLGSAGKLKRPLSLPSQTVGGKFASAVSGFTNLVFGGVAAHYTPDCAESRDIYINPNLLFYWQQKPTRKFDAVSQLELPQNARTYLGTEINLFSDFSLVKDFKLFIVGSVFVPGGHFADIRGKPINAAQLKALSAANATGFDETFVPNIGTDIAFTFNIGLDYKF